MNLSRAFSGQLTAIKTLKIGFREFSGSLTDNKFVFLNFKSIAVMTGPIAFLLQPKLFWLAVLFSKHLMDDFNVTYV